ncbi:hypothetical protein [Deinococcus metallilatus]|uniref:Uncharacterized protein n=1 Tax=Deinococcus metallilatus TaxID=1211322 RepID=A0ABR6MMK9_9DEIO|nr:hypothetical protein [Deinococcus metallilatus]MBB5293196.1 hypothetical protein [Deinococcus metallilatus]
MRNLLLSLLLLWGGTGAWAADTSGANTGVTPLNEVVWPIGG